MSEAAAPAVDVKENHEGDVKECDSPPPSGSVTASLLQNLIFLNWVQYPPLPRVMHLVMLYCNASCNDLSGT